MDFYTKTEIDEKFGVTISSPSWRDLYTKTEIEANVGTPEMLVLPADMLDFYTKTEIDSVPAVTPEYSDTDKTTVILLDSNGNRTDEIRQFSAAATNPLSAVRSFLQGQTSNKYDVVIGKDFMTGYTGGASGVIQNSGFVNCASMVNLEIYCTSTGQGTTYVNSLGGYFCQNCTSLKRVVFPSSLRNIGTACFYNCPLLEGTIKFPGSVETIGGISFFECSSVQKIEIPATITSIDRTAFRGCSTLQEIVIDKPQDSIANAPWTWNGSAYDPADVPVTWTG